MRIEARSGDNAICGRVFRPWHNQPVVVADRTSLVGMPVIGQMRLPEPGQWAGGRLYNPEDGRDYKGSPQLR